MLINIFTGTVSGLQLHPGGKFHFKLKQKDVEIYKQFVVNPQTALQLYYSYVLAAYLTEVPLTVLAESGDPATVVELACGNM